MRGIWKGTAVAAAVLAAGGSIAGCRGERSEKRPRQFIPDMDDSPKWKPQIKSEFFEDMRTMRPVVPGTVAFGENERLDETSRAQFLKADEAFYNGITSYDANGAPVFVPTIPVASFDGWPAQANEGESAADLLTRRETFVSSIIERGQQRFDIYCAVCHGYAGDGKGMVGQRWSGPVANFHDPKYVDVSAPQGLDGYIFNVIRHGVPFPNKANEPLRMPAYAHAVNEADAWAIVAYLRVLQSTRTGIDAVPPAHREQLRNVPKPAPLTVPEPAPATPASPTNPPTTPTQGGGNQ